MRASPRSGPAIDGRQERADEARRVAAGAGEDVEEPARRRALAVRPGDADEASVAVAAASAMTCCTLSGGIPTSRAATSSGWSGSTAVSALVTASRSRRRARPRRGRARRRCASRSRSRPPGRRRCTGRDRPRRSPSRRAPTAAARIAAPDDAAPPAPDDVDPRPGRIGPAARAGASPREMSAEVRVIDRRPATPASAAAVPAARSSRSVSAAAALASLFAARSPVQRNRRTSAPAASATAT